MRDASAFLYHFFPFYAVSLWRKGYIFCAKTKRVEERKRPSFSDNGLLLLSLQELAYCSFVPPSHRAAATPSPPFLPRALTSKKLAPDEYFPGAKTPFFLFFFRVVTLRLRGFASERRTERRTIESGGGGRGGRGRKREFSQRANREGEKKRGRGREPLSRSHLI